MKKEKIPTIIGLFMLLGGIFAGVFLIKNQQIFKLGASTESVPQDVRISNVSDSSLTVSWTTDKETAGFVKWGESENNLNKVENDSIADMGYTHSTTLRSLTANTDYYFRINSDAKDYDNQGKSWQTKTGPELSEPTKNIIISGSVLTESGVAAKNALVYFNAGGGSLLSTVTSQEGSWLIPITHTRNKNLSSYMSIANSSTLVEISVNAGIKGVASAQIYPQSAKPAPPIILGQVNDFKNSPISQGSEIPNASIEVPDQEIEAESGFEVSENESTNLSSTVTLESLDEGEVVTTQDPEFFGKGPTGTEIEIIVESEIQTDTVSVASNGSWNWSPPEDLEEGSHTVTIKWKDINGIIRTLTRNFIVQASDSPAFVSTPSASPSSTPSASPSSTPKATITASSSATPIEQPVSGSLTQTLLLSIMGIGTILFGFILWKQSEL